MQTTKGKKIAVFDTETDPFLQNRIPKPFTCAFYDGSLYLPFWGDDCVDRCLEAVAALDDEYVIYVHNGGKFDFWFMLDWIDHEREIFIINGRIVEFKLEGTNHVFRDSLSIIPVPLGAYQKEEIDYSIFEDRTRETPANRLRISKYLKSDCINLFELVSRFGARFADERGNIPISIGQASIRELIDHHPFTLMSEASDAEIRPWYIGGRVQCFRAGIVKGPWKVYDVNSMYPHVMAEHAHPMCDLYESLDRPPRATGSVWFAEFEGSNRQALPVDTGEGIDFTVRHGIFRACSHELVPAIAAGLVRVKKWRTILKPSKTGKFRDFVVKWSDEKISAKKAGDKANEIFAKLIMNSAYGKTGQNPDDFKDYKILRDPMKDRRLREDGYEPEARISSEPFIEVWSRKSGARQSGYYNVGIASSVTSAARHVLLEGLQQAVDPIYCDTDSIVCRNFTGNVHPTALGAWKLEATADYAAIAGKKLYCLYNMNGRKIVPVKWASKGGDLDPLDIIRIAKGSTVEHTAEVPTFSLSRGIGFTTRNFRKTVDKPRKFK